MRLKKQEIGVKMMPRLSDLPAPPSGRTGWPWTEGSRPLPDTLPDGQPWPKVSIVTPSYNQGWALEETLRSVILQGYPNLEYIVMDDGSTDKSVEIIQKYEPWLTYWQTAENQGQTQVLNQGFARATGEVFGWMNSDDIILPNGIEKLMRLRAEKPDCIGWVGAAEEIDKEGNPLRVVVPRLGKISEMLNWSIIRENGSHIYQPGCLFSAQAFRDVGGLDEYMWCAMDLDLWVRLREEGDFALMNAVVASPRLYTGAKSNLTEIGVSDVRQYVDLITIAYKMNNHGAGDQVLENYGKELRQHVLKNLSAIQAMRGVSNKEFMNYISMHEIFHYSLSRSIKALAKRLFPAR